MRLVEFFYPEGALQQEDAPSTRLPTLAEVMGLTEVDPFEPQAKLKHPGHSMPAGMGTKVKPQGAPPRSTAKQAPPQKRVDPATEFLRSKGALGGISGPGSGNAPAGQSTPRRSGQSGAGSVGGGQPVNKPKYAGSYVGQTVDMGGKYVAKPVSWQSQGPSGPERKFGSVQGKSTEHAVWDGGDWVSQADFDKKFQRK